MVSRRTLIMGAGGRDFHNFLMFFKNRKEYEVVAFTWAQIEGASITSFPKELAGYLYDEDIPIVPEDELETIISERAVEQVFFCYSDVSHEYVMHVASRVNAAGADFILKGPRDVMVDTGLPTIAVTAVRTGCGKSGVTRYVAKFLKSRGKNPVIIRHPMAYRDIIKQRAERFATYDDLIGCTIEEREEFEPLINAGFVVWCGVDYQTIIKEAIRADKPTHFVWDGGNNDFSFLKYDKQIVVVDPFRWNHTHRFYPGEMNLLTADVVVVNKANTADPMEVDFVEEIVEENNRTAKIVRSTSKINMSDEEIESKLKDINKMKILVVEDGPTTTHGNMNFGIGGLTINRLFGVAPRMVSAIGYNNEQLQTLEDAINNDSLVDLVIISNNVDLTRLIKINKPYINWTYDNEFEGPEFDEMLEELVGV